MRLYLMLIGALVVATSTASAGEWIEGRVTHVRDVDTIEVNNLPVSLNGVDGPELNERQGRAGKRWMQKLVLRTPVKCWLNGDKTYDRWVENSLNSSNNRFVRKSVIEPNSTNDRIEPKPDTWVAGTHST